MKEHPILFSGEMVRAILEGRKAQTRRPIKPQPQGGHCASMADDGIWAVLTEIGWGGEFACNEIGHCPYGIPGDRLWVRETWQAWEDPETGQDYLRYRADGAKIVPDWPNTEEAWGRLCGYFDRWYPSIHMPRWAARITLEVTGVRVERVQDIGQKDALAEGCPCGELTRKTIHALKHSSSGLAAIEWFVDAWNAIYLDRGLGWEANPWVWVVEFRHTEEAT